MASRARTRVKHAHPMLVICLVGSAGSGKTAISNRVLHELRHEHHHYHGRSGNTSPTTKRSASFHAGMSSMSSAPLPSTAPGRPKRTYKIHHISASELLMEVAEKREHPRWSQVSHQAVWLHCFRNYFNSNMLTHPVKKGGESAPGGRAGGRRGDRAAGPAEAHPPPLQLEQRAGDGAGRLPDFEAAG